MPGDLSNIASAVAGILQPALPGPSRNPLAVGPPNVPQAPTTSAGNCYVSALLFFCLFSYLCAAC